MLAINSSCDYILMFNTTDIHLDAPRDYRNQLVKYSIIQEELKKIKKDLARGRCEHCFLSWLGVGGISVLVYFSLRSYI